MDKKVVRAGIVGAGFAARFHYDALQRVFSTKVEIVGAYSPCVTGLDEYTNHRNLMAYGDLDELISNCDLIHICTSPITHEPIVIAALAQNKDVIVEKPFTGYFGDGSSDFMATTSPAKRVWNMHWKVFAGCLMLKRKVRGGSCMPKTGSIKNSRKGWASFISINGDMPCIGFSKAITYEDIAQVLSYQLLPLCERSSTRCAVALPLANVRIVENWR